LLANAGLLRAASVSAGASGQSGSGDWSETDESFIISTDFIEGSSIAKIPEHTKTLKITNRNLNL
jgi:hypothetical protein